MLPATQLRFTGSQELELKLPAGRTVGELRCEISVFSFLATLVALHFTPVSEWVSGQSFGLA